MRLLYFYALREPRRAAAASEERSGEGGGDATLDEVDDGGDGDDAAAAAAATSASSFSAYEQFFISLFVSDIALPLLSRDKLNNLLVAMATVHYQQTMRVQSPSRQHVARLQTAMLLALCKYLHSHKMLKVLLRVQVRIKD